MKEKSRDDVPMNEMFRALAQELAASLEEGEEVAGHLTIEEIFSYLGDEEEAEHGDRIRGHLVDCSRCLQDLLSAADLRSAEEVEENADFEIAAAWRALQERLRAENLERERDEARQENIEHRSRQRARRRWRQVITAAAACLFLILGGAVRRAHLELRALERPQLNALVEDVMVPTERTRGAAVPARVELSAGVSMVTLIFPLASQNVFAAHRVEILTEDGRPVWQAQGVLRVDAGTWNLGLPRNFLTPGKYQVRLLGLASGEEPEELGTYFFDLNFLE